MISSIRNKHIVNVPILITTVTASHVEAIIISFYA